MAKLKGLLLLGAGATLLAGHAIIGDNTVTKKSPQFDLSIRYVDSYTVIQQSDQGKEIAKVLEAKRAELSKQIKDMEQMYVAAAKELQAKASTLSDAGREREQKKMVKMEREYKAKVQECNEDIKITMQSKQERLLRDHNDAVEKYAQANNIDLVFGPHGVVYASEKASCTLDVVAGMNKTRQLKVAGAKTNKKDLVVASKTKSTQTV